MIDCQTLVRWDEIYGYTSYIEVGINDDDIIEAQFAKWFKDYVRVVISS